PDHFPRVVHHHHGAIIQIGDALVVFLAFFQDEHFHDFARQHDWFKRVRQLIDVQHRDPLKLRNLVQVEVVSDDLALVELGQLDQLQVHFANGGEIVFHDLDLQRRHFLQALQDFQAAAAAVALERVGRIGDQLQLAQDELRNYDDAVEEAGFGDIGDPAIDDDTGVQNFVALLALLFAAEDTT